MDLFMSAVNWYGALPSAVMIAIGIFLVAIIVGRLKPLEALKASIYVGGGMIGINTMTNMFAGAVAPVLSTVVTNLGLNLDVLDLGIGSMQASVTFPMNFYAILLPIGLAVNLVMIFTKLTDTFDVDIFNYFVWSLSSGFVMALTGSLPFAIAAFIITEIVCLKLADITQPAIEEAYGLVGVSIPHGNAVVFAPIGMAVNAVIEKIPALAKIDWSTDFIEQKFGGLVQPSTIGFVVGIGFGIAGGLDFGGTVNLAITVAAFMIIFPKVLGTLIEGVQPVADGMREVTEKKLNRDLHIGLDAAVLVGMPDVMATGILLTPVTLLLAFILPGNRVVPMADLAIACPFLISCCMPFCKKNIFRGFICGLIVMTIALYVCTFTAEAYTAIAAMNGLPFETVSTSLGGSSTWLSAIFAAIASLFGA
ncbi:PTS transporter subunit IIC [Enorma sp.]|uniref:PTS transporter subunit IIC n=1 Tax=Enorma sp. TaxID=1920692 RepID=UPI0025C066F8|nr:PTS transporter subunit IIC [Enorma sp.]